LKPSTEWGIASKYKGGPYGAVFYYEKNLKFLKYFLIRF